jgi:uncharacterized protein YcbX
MPVEIGHVEAIFRYPVKSTGGERLEAANLGWHASKGDRRLAFRRIANRSDFPWLTASKLPDLLRFAALCREDGAQEDLPNRIRTSDSVEMPVFGEDLAAEVGRRSGTPVRAIAHTITDEHQFRKKCRVQFDEGNERQDGLPHLSNPLSNHKAPSTCGGCRLRRAQLT